MTTRSDIIHGSQASHRKYGLIYTLKCGWVDLGHAHPSGALKLWQSIINEPQGSSSHYQISYNQVMGNRHLKIGISKTFNIKRGLTIADKQSVALGIFLNVSHDFEQMQGNWIFRHFTNSGYSAEDLVSNLVGFYRAIDPTTDYIKICEPVQKELALQLWDTYGAVGEQKNNSILPYLYPLPPKPTNKPYRGQLPIELTTITPAKPGALYHLAD
ncbi:DUF4056 domain-containing protein [Corallincola holothuriorum]|nr:DUF4056 domain-containing protein [Corallincola holothuriorum]